MKKALIYLATMAVLAIAGCCRCNPPPKLYRVAWQPVFAIAPMVTHGEYVECSKAYLAMVMANRNHPDIYHWVEVEE